MKNFLRLLLSKIAYEFRFLQDEDFWMAVGVVSTAIVFVVGVCFGVGSIYKYFDPDMYKGTCFSSHPQYHQVEEKKENYS